MVDLFVSTDVEAAGVISPVVSSKETQIDFLMLLEGTL